MTSGYDKPLFILPFDHRSSFLKLLNITGEPTPEQTERVASFKQIIYEGFKRAVASGVPKASAAILVDEQFGSAILKDAKADGYTFCLTIEKSGQDEFDFEYGEDFGKHIEHFHPSIVKVLVRYNPGSDRMLNRRQRERLKILSDFCHQHGYPFLFELLTPATEEQLKKAGGDADHYDHEIRPALTVLAVAELQAAGIEPDIWKMEGLVAAADYEALVRQIRSDGRDRVGMIVLGRGADPAKVERWLATAAKIHGVIGFAVGRTTFANALKDVRDGAIDRDAAAEQIAKNYRHFYDLFTSSQG